MTASRSGAHQRKALWSSSTAVEEFGPTVSWSSRTGFARSVTSNSESCTPVRRPSSVAFCPTPSSSPSATGCR